MSFTSWPLDFAREVAEAVHSIRRDLFGQYLPPALYHYTSLEGVLGIGNSRILRATCVEDLGDQAEIRHGMEMVLAEIQQKEDSGIACFPKMVFTFLPETLAARKPWTFVACFCAKRASSFHQERYGPYCLRFDTLSSWDPRLRPLGLQADVQYHRVIYEPLQKRDAIRRALRSVVASAVSHSRGAPVGPWAASVARIHARMASQSLMDIISCFKGSDFRQDAEWRIVCRPRFSAAGSAPDLDDEGFRPLIKSGDKRHVELRVQEQGEILVAFPRSVIPFSLIDGPDDSRRRDSDQQRIRQMLQENGRSDIELG